MTMGMMPGPGIGGGSALPTQTTFSTVNKASDILLTSGNTIAGTSSTSTGGIVLSNTVKTTGKFYVEISIDSASNNDGALGAGIHLGTSTLTNYLGQDTNGFGSWLEATNRTKIDTTTNAVSTNVTNGASHNPAAGQYVRIAVDVAAGKLWLSRFGDTSWAGGGDPASGTSPTYTFTGGSSTYFAACPRSYVNTLMLVAPASWASAAPTGFGVWT